MKFILSGSNRVPVLFALLTVILLLPFFALRSDAAKDAEAPRRQTVRLGVITLYHPLVMYRKYQPFADYLTRSTPYEFELKISEGYSQIMVGLRRGTIDAAILGGLTYLEATREADILPLVSALGQNGDPTCRGAFITRGDNPEIRQLSDIKGKRFAFASSRSTSGNLMPLNYLYTRTSIRIDDFESHEHLKYHDSVVREVLRGNFDAGVALDTIAVQYESVGLRIIGQTDPFPGFVLVVRRDLSPQITASIREVLLALDPEKENHRNHMEEWDVNIRFGFAPAADKDFDCIRRAIDHLESIGIKWR